MYLDASTCSVCAGMDESECDPVCKDNILLTESLVDKAAATLKGSICMDFGTIGALFRMIYGIDTCISEVNLEL